MVIVAVQHRASSPELQERGYTYTHVLSMELTNVD